MLPRGMAFGGSAWRDFGRPLRDLSVNEDVRYRKAERVHVARPCRTPPLVVGLRSDVASWKGSSLDRLSEERLLSGTAPRPERA